VSENGDRFAIRVKNLSKQFGMYSSPAGKLMEIISPFRRHRAPKFWALRNVTFRVREGEAMGIIGRNGSGKSTLLQVLSGVLRETSGEVKVNGRLSALLELGAGFHPEFRGRDNVYMNGDLMGMSRKEMDARFEAIADFAEIGEFMEQPIKTYSSGMFVRLAFACAVNIAPDILIVDEALAVGDAYFQKKCMQRIAEFRNNGGSMLFASHDMDAVRSSCDYAILLNKGTIVESGDPDRVTAYYEEMNRDRAGFVSYPSQREGGWTRASLMKRHPYGLPASPWRDRS
jgi:lipopolysaccharide transport system ATP-binding protein